ncbi:hypothetical protein KRP22_012793 [Phytophthora ramorum]|nr:ATP-binding cassette sub-family C member 4 [Phytophthora ramorum]
MTEQHPYVAGPPTPKSQRSAEDASRPFREQEHPIRSASLLSMVSMSWLQPLISLGAKRALEREDVWAMCPEDTCEVLRETFEEELRAVNNDVEAPPLWIPRVAVALVKTFRSQIAVVFASDLLFIAGSALMSFLVGAILDYLNDRGNVFGINNGYVFVVMLSAVAFASMMSFNFAWFISSRVGVNMRSLLLDAVYRKSLRLSSEARQQYSSGEIMTLVSVDIDRVFNGMMNGPWVVLAPVGFAVTIVLIGVLFDPIAALAGLVLLIVILTTSFTLAKRIGTARRELLPVTEERLRVTSEALQGIRVTKFYAWNESIAARVERIRREEVNRYRRFHFLQILNSALLFLTPTFLAGVTVGVYVAYRGSFSVIQAFTLIAVINVSRQGVNAFPLGIADLSQSASTVNVSAVGQSKQQTTRATEEQNHIEIAPSDGEGAHSKDQLVEKEDRVKGKVTGYIYKTYLDETGISAFVVALIVVSGYSVSQGLLVLVNWWQAYWADSIPQQGLDSSYSATWFGLWYFGFIAFGSIATVCRSVIVMLLLLRSSKNLHDELFRRVLAAPVNTYFDVTPVGRILNRFSNDLDQMDSLLPQQWQNFVQNVSLSVGGFIVCALASYWIGLSYVPVVVALVVTGFYFKKTSREVKRLEGISRSPVYNLLGETLNGVQTIRAFKMETTFEGLNASAVDENASFFFIYWAAGRWLAWRQKAS